MKSRSHRLPPSDTPDDWVDGSWTVDCSCGVTFDDGEEMVSCDECGVWVHTRCSRFVKGEASFACHNCKNNNNSSNSSRKPSSAVAADTEETEVAQLLVELPTKTDPGPPPNLFQAPVYRPPFRLWAEVPLEERVHVQGVPGGDPALFQGISSSVFSSELWRCSGYVPKKFNFQYREFSCWDEDGAENPASQGADVLFSLSKEIVPSRVPVRALERKQEGEKVLFGGRFKGWGKKERNRLRVFGSHTSKKRKEEVGEGKDRHGKKKKAQSDADRVAAESKKKDGVTAVDMKKAGSFEDRRAQVAESDVPTAKSEPRKDDGIPQQNLGDQVEGLDGDSKPRHVLVIKASKGDTADDVPRPENALELSMKVDTEDGSTGNSLKGDASSVPKEKCEDDVREFCKEENTELQMRKGLSECRVSPDLSKHEDGFQQPKDNCLQEDQNVTTQARLASSGSCQKNEKSNQQDPQPPPKLLPNSSSLQPQPSASILANLSDEEVATGLNRAAHPKQPKEENHVQGDLNASTQAKLATASTCQKNEKMNHSVPLPPSKLLSHSMSMHSSASGSAATILSDEELALLLHQELNSSPRVPRVPRMRQASSMQLSQSAPSMLSKRSSHPGGKDQVFRRKNKEEASRDGSRNTQESRDELRKVGRALTSPDRRYRESSLITEGPARKYSRNRSPDAAVPRKKNMSAASADGEKCSEPSFEAGKQDTSSIKCLPRDAAYEKTTYHTLPGLIDEILSKEKCSTYEELCDLVQPHWHNCRKPNGERYAYSSHSHAVLDCLRNRSEWAHLIERGPKTNSSKRRRKLDSDTLATGESEDEAKDKASGREMEDKNGSSQREEFPKGKRKARKRRRLELHGRGMEAQRRKHTTSSGSVISSDDDDEDDDGDGESAAEFSHSNNGGVDSKDESHGDVDRAVRAETAASTNSDGSR